MKTRPTQRNTTKDKSWTRHLTLEEKFQLNQNAYDYWCQHPHLNLAQVVQIHNMTEQKLRCWMRAYKKPRPFDDIYGRKKDRHGWIVKAYNKGLEEDLTATTVAKWASEQSGCFMRRGDIQYYAYKFNLPQLREDNNGTHLAKTSKYA